jgi:hypothetical protein
MQLEGSCHCGQVSFRLESAHPYPFNLCYCSICRKTAGGGGYAINLGGEFSTLKITGEEHASVYQAKVTDPETGETVESPARRHFCANCGSALWVWDPRWPELVHPLSRASWVEMQTGANDKKFDGYPQESIAQWHQRLGLEDTGN